MTNYVGTTISFEFKNGKSCSHFLEFDHSVDKTEALKIQKELNESLNTLEFVWSDKFWIRMTEVQHIEYHL